MGQTMRTMASDETNKLIDAEIKALVEGAHYRATDILKTHEDQLHLLAQALLEYETLTGEEIKALLETGKVDRPGFATRPQHSASGARLGHSQGRQALRRRAGIGRRRSTAGRIVADHCRKTHAMASGAIRAPLCMGAGIAFRYIATPDRQFPVTVAA